MRVTLSASMPRTCSNSNLRDPIRHGDDVHGHLGGEAPHLGLGRPPLGHTPALGHPKELAERLQAYAAREGMSSG
jgi:hypothetical protein